MHPLVWFRRPLLAIALLFPAAPAHADPALELIVHRARRPLGVSSAADDARFATRLERLGLAPLRSLDDGLPPERTTDAARPGPLDLDPSRFLLVAARDSVSAAAARAALMADPSVVWVEPNAVREPAELPPDFPSDPFFDDSRQWGLMNRGPAGAYGGAEGADIRAREAWALSVGANDVRLAVADSGVDPDHPELQAPVAGGGYRMESGANVTGDPNPAWPTRSDTARGSPG